MTLGHSLCEYSEWDNLFAIGDCSVCFAFFGHEGDLDFILEEEGL